ncbi:MAG: formate dehydrogenase accessory sulfurtransferase FdhD [Thermoplasmataceae archaeon]
METGVAIERVTRFSEPMGWTEDSDNIVTEEPMEIRLLHNGKAESIAVTMRTPVNDEELAIGFLFSEGFIKKFDDITSVRIIENGNVVEVSLSCDTKNTYHTGRNFYMSSSCGVCGKSNINEIFLKGVGVVHGSARISSRMLLSLPEKMRRKQKLFGYTGGIHAASLFDVSGRHLVTMEDIGRHNAVDKCIGYMLSNRLIGKMNTVLQISGRGGFEILQKAAMAGIPIVSSVSAPSSLAIDVAETFGITLVCFVRNDRFNVYANPQRILA